MGVFFDKIILQEKSLEGFTNRILPIDSVSYTYFSFRKPWKGPLVFILFIAIIAVLSKSFGLLVGGLVLAVIYYFLNKGLYIGIREQSGKRFSLGRLNRSLIEGEGATVERLELATKIIATLIDQHKVRPTRNFDQENQSS